jgi:predicted PurR-regulated permease PerM
MLPRTNTERAWPLMSVPTPQMPQMPQQDHSALPSDQQPTSDSAGPGPSGWSVTIAPRTLWLALGLVVLTAGGWLVLAKGLSVLILLFTAIVIAEGLRPIIDFLHKRLRLSQPAAVLLVYLLILLVVGALTWLLLQAVVVQSSTFIDALPRLNAQLDRQLQELRRWLGASPQLAGLLTSLGSQGGALLQGALATLVRLPQTLGSLIVGGVVVVVMVFFWLTGIAALRPFVLGLLPVQSQPLAQDVLVDISRRLGGYVRGVVVNGCVIGVLSTLGVWLLGAPFPLLLGLVAGLTQVIPYFGPWISGAIAVIVVLPLAGPLTAVEVLGFYIVLQTIEGNTLTPLIMRDTVNINPLLAIVAVLLGSALLGVAGAVLGVPAMAILQVLVVRVLAPIARRAAATVNANGNGNGNGNGARSARAPLPEPDRAEQAP